MKNLLLLVGCLLMACDPSMPDLFAREAASRGFATANGFEYSACHHRDAIWPRKSPCYGRTAGGLLIKYYCIPGKCSQYAEEL